MSPLPAFLLLHPIYIYIYIIPPFLPSFFHQLVPHHLPTIILTPNFPTTEKRKGKEQKTSHKHDIPNIKPLQFPSPRKNLLYHNTHSPRIPSYPPFPNHHHHHPTTTTTNLIPKLPTSQLPAKTKN